MIKNDKDNIEYLKAILDLVDLHKLDSLEISGIKIVKSKHIIENIEPIKKDEDVIDDEAMYYSV